MRKEILVVTLELLVAMQVLELSPRYAIKTLHTPGHTMESVVYLLIDRQSNDKPLQVRGCVAKAREGDVTKD